MKQQSPNREQSTSPVVFSAAFNGTTDTAALSPRGDDAPNMRLVDRSIMPF